MAISSRRNGFGDCPNAVPIASRLDEMAISAFFTLSTFTSFSRGAIFGARGWVRDQFRFGVGGSGWVFEQRGTGMIRGAALSQTEYWMFRGLPKLSQYGPAGGAPSSPQKVLDPVGAFGWAGRGVEGKSERGLMWVDASVIGSVCK